MFGEETKMSRLTLSTPTNMAISSVDEGRSRLTCAEPVRACTNDDGIVRPAMLSSSVQILDLPRALERYSICSVSKVHTIVSHLAMEFSL